MLRADTSRTDVQKIAIANDYAANIAAGLQILAQKWNQLLAIQTSANNSDPQYLENWYLAIWAYNSGIHSDTGVGPYGVGWFNNPANPTYDANRQPFLRGSLDDASHPGSWPYQERVMGWAETPQWQWIDPITKYSKPSFGPSANNLLSLPGRLQFCSAPSACFPNLPGDPCPSEDSSCWWHGHTSWVTNCATSCARERLTYSAGSAEPQLIRVYPTRCSPFGDPVFTQVVDDLADSADNVLGCTGQLWGGKFTLRTGFPSGSTYAAYGQIDLHQLGAGYLGHSWFTHTYDGSYDEHYHEVVGTWTPNISQTNPTEVLAHLTSHGSNASATYVIKPNDGTGVEFPCTINQDISSGLDKWVYLGAYVLAPGAKVQLSNMVPGADGSVDIGYDAMAFKALPSAPYHSCGQVYTP
jgi:hypothetical protein